MRLNFSVLGTTLLALVLGPEEALTFQSISKFRNQQRSSHSKLFSATGSAQVPLERTAPREIGPFQDWALQFGVQLNPETGFGLGYQEVDGIEDWFARANNGGPQGTPVLFVPNQLILSSAQLQENVEFFQPSFQILEQQQMPQELFHQFFLFARVLMEYEKGMESAWYPWLAAMPRKWNTAVSMDEFCLSCLPPFIKSLCIKERDQLAAFREALQPFQYLSPQTKANAELLKFAYNVVASRAVPSHNGFNLVPFGDMFNYGYPGNVALSFDEVGNCQAVLTQDVPPGAPLLMNYGQPENPSRFLSVYGFLDEPPATYCKLVIPNPSREIIDIGYHPSRMLFFTENGAISPEVWDVMLYSKLERKSEWEHYRQAFYNAHMSGDQNTKSQIHMEFQKFTVSWLLTHVNGILAEIAELAVKMNAYDSSKHPRLPLLRKHNNLVASTFQKVKANLEQMKASMQ